MATVLKVVLGIGLLVLAVVVLFTWVFPWVERSFLTDPTLALLIRA